MTSVVCLAGFTVCLLLTFILRHADSRRLLRRGVFRKLGALVSVILFAALLFTPTQATTITEYVVPGNPGLWDLSPSNTSTVIWFTESAGNNIGILAYNNGTLKQIPVPTLNSQPWGITTVNWPFAAAVFTESYGNKIGVVAANGTRKIAEYSIPTPGSGPRKIILDPWRNCTWFTEYTAGKIGKFNFTTATSWLANFVEYRIPGAGSNPVGIAIDTIGPSPKRRYVWFADFSRWSIVRFLPEMGQFREYSVYPFSPWDVTVDADGMVWFTAQRVGTDENIIGRLNPIAYETSMWSLTIFRVPTPNSEVHDIEVDSRGNIWFTEFSDYASKIGKYVPLANVFMEYPIITPTAKPQGLALNQTGTMTNVWFTEYGGRRIGRLIQPEGPTVTTTVYSVTYAVTTSTTINTITTSPTITNSTVAVVASTATPAVATMSAATASSTIIDTVSTVLTSPTYWSTTYTYTTSTSFTTSTTTYTQTIVSVETTSTTTSTTFTYVSTSWESVTTLTTATVVSTSWFSETTSTTATLTQISTIFSPTVTVPTTTTAKTNTTLYSPTVVRTSTVLTETATTTTSTMATTTTSYSPTVTLTSTATSFTTFLAIRPCIIASAAYGSELAPEVQSLRTFRDWQVLSTFAGIQFMKAFNAFYYSFSPTVASMVASAPIATALVRVLLYPLISILQVSSTIFDALVFAPELGMVAAGLFAGALVGIVYLAPPVAGARCLIKRRRRDARRALIQTPPRQLVQR